MPISVTSGGQFKEVAYGCKDIDLMFGLLGISRYGTQSYLPPGVAGSFEGASRRNLDRNVPVVVEDDGLVTLLRNSTNGQWNGAYYSYYTAADSGLLTNYRPTNTRYLPKFLPNHKPSTVCRGTDGVFLGMATPNAGGNDVPFIALTSGTLNQDLHVGCVLTGWSTPNTQRTVPVIDGDYVYIFYWDVTGIQLSVTRVAIADIRANESVTPTAVTGWTTTRSWAATVSNNDKIILSEASSSLSNPGHPSYISNPDSNFKVDSPVYSGWEVHAASNGAGKIRLRIGSEHYTVTNDNADQRGWWQLSFVVDVNAKTVTPDTGVTLPIQLTYNLSTQVITRTGAVAIDRAVGEGTPLGNWYPSLAFNLSKGKLYSYGTPNEGVARMLVSNLANGITSEYDALVFNKPVSTQQNLPIPDAFGSAVGGELRKPHLLPNNRILTFGFYNPTPGQIASGWVLSEMGTDGFAYSTIAGNLTGRAPTTNRAPVSADAYVGGISEVSAAGAITYTPAQFSSNNRLSCPQSLDQNLQPVNGNVVSIPQSLLDSTLTLLLLGASITASDTAKKALSVFVPLNTSLPAILTAMVIADDGTAWSVIGTATPNNRSSGITQLASVTYRDKVQTGNSNANRSIGIANPTGGASIYEGTDCWMFSVTGRNSVSYPGNSNTVSWRGYFAKASPGTMVQASLVAIAEYTYINNQDVGLATPWGFGHINAQVDREVLSGTAISFVPTAKSIAEYNAWVGSTPKVLISQIVAQGWYVYFTEEMPLLINGKEHTLPIVTVDLTEIKANPANSTFYAYAQGLEDGTARYLVLATPAAETSSYFHIGNIYTDATQVLNHTIQKTTMFGGKHLSPTRRGNSIPVSSGNPAVGGGEYLW